MVLDSAFPPDIRVEKEASSLIQAGHEVHLLCYKFNSSQPDRETYSGIQIHRVQIHRQVAKKMLGLNTRVPVFKIWWKSVIKKMLQALNPDILYTHDLPTASAVIKIPEYARPFWILDLHENYPVMLQDSMLGKKSWGRFALNIPGWKNLEKRALLEASAVVTVSPEHGERLTAISGKSIISIPNTARADEFPVIDLNKTEKKKPIKLLYVGGVDESRDLETVLNGLSKTDSATANWELIILGDGGMKSELIRQSEALGLSNRARFIPPVPQKEVGRFCAEADLGLLPLIVNEHTNLTDPNKLYQYLYYGLPVLAAKTKRLEGLNSTLQFGSLYDSGNPDHFRTVLESMLKDPESIAEKGRVARLRMVEMYMWENTVTPLLDLVASVPDQTRTASRA